MTTEVITCHPEDDVEEVVAVMLEKHLKTVPVLDKEERLVGIFSRHDVIELIAAEN